MAVGKQTLRSFAVVTVLFGAVWGLYRVFDKLIGDGADSELFQVLLPILSLALVVLALALAGVLIRNLVRLVVEHKRGILGARLRSKLVFYYLALVLLPALVLFYGSAHVIKQSVEAVLKTPLEELTQRSGAIVQEWREYLQSQALDIARSVAREVERQETAGGASEDLSELLQRWQLEDDPRHIRVTLGERIVAEVEAGSVAIDPQRRDELERLIEELQREVIEAGQERAHIDYLGEGLVAHAAVPLFAPEGGGAAGTVSVGIVLPSSLAGNLEEIDRASKVYRQFRVQRRELVRLYLTLTGLVFLTTIFVATWIGFYVARRITRPIQEMADATREIASGNLDVRVETEIGDELGMLVDAFNEMAAELEENREVITRSTADLQRTNRALDERRRYIETLLANLSTAVLSLDPDGRVTTANPAVEEILDVDLQIGDDAARRLRDGGLHPLADLISPRSRAKTDSLRRDLALEHHGGSLNVSVQVSSLRGSSGEHLGTLMMVEDLTELLRAQRSAAWREVARRIAHEIKNPLTPIQLWAQRLRRKFLGSGAEQEEMVAEATGAIEREVQALKQLVDEFSLFARLPEVRPRVVDLAGLVESVLGLYRGLPGVDWDVDLGAGLERVRIDPDQIRRVLINLVDNALTAMNRRGLIRVAAKWLDDGTTVRMEVADQGPGIDPADRDKMFSPYFSTKKRGTGLGLAIVHKVVTDHEGSIRVEANQPSGARFVIEIPSEDVTPTRSAGGAGVG